MTLADRLAALRANAGGLSHAPAATDREPSLVERVERMAATARRRAAGELAIARILEGEVVAPGLIRIDRSIPLAARHGRLAYAALASAPLEVLCPEADCRPSDLVFLDTETTGLAGGTGTLAFLLAVARVDATHVHLTQWLLTAFRGEAVMLQAAAAWLAPDAHLATYNGRSFDVPLLSARCRMNGLADPFYPLPHLDLLNPVRRAFASRWEDCRLQTAETRLLRFHREDDLPGSAMPAAWVEFVKTGDAAPMVAVLEHNRRDVLSLIVLTAALADAYANPDASVTDATALARAHLAAGRRNQALALLRSQGPLLDVDGLLLLASLLRRAHEYEGTLAIWTRLAAQDCPEAIEHLAKHFEHGSHDYRAALELSERLTRIAGGESSARRRSRLDAKLARAGHLLHGLEPARPPAFDPPDASETHHDSTLRHPAGQHRRR